MRVPGAREPVLDERRRRGEDEEWQSDGNRQKRAPATGRDSRWSAVSSRGSDGSGAPEREPGEGDRAAAPASATAAASRASESSHSRPAAPFGRKGPKSPTRRRFLPRRGSTILATIGSTRKSRKALAKRQMVKTASTAMEKVVCRWSSRAAALIKSGYLGRRVPTRSHDRFRQITTSRSSIAVRNSARGRRQLLRPADAGSKSDAQRPFSSKPKSCSLSDDT